MLAAMRSFWFPVYRALGPALAPLARRRLARDSQRYPQLAGREPERLGQVPMADGELWIHAASVGELNAADGLITALLEQRPALNIVLSTVTATAAVQARSRFAGRPRIRHLFAPVDTAGAVRRWLDRTRPAALILFETELWPMMLTECARRRLPVSMVNARISGRAFGRYRRVAGLFRPLLADIDPVLCQGDVDRTRLAALGVRERALSVTGNLKFDRTPETSRTPVVETWQAAWGERPAWIAGSTHDGEESMIAAAHRLVVDRIPDALAVVVPRHPERADEALGTLREAGLEAIRIDAPAADFESAQALVVNQVGVLRDLYSAASACFVGGSLVDGIGGHNLIEPAIAGCAILTGPFTADQVEAADGLERSGGLQRVNDADDLAHAVVTLLVDSQQAATRARKARTFIEAQRGALDRTMKVLADWPPPT